MPAFPKELFAHLDKYEDDEYVNTYDNLKDAHEANEQTVTPMVARYKLVGYGEVQEPKIPTVKFKKEYKVK